MGGGYGSSPPQASKLASREVVKGINRKCGWVAGVGDMQCEGGRGRES